MVTHSYSHICQTGSSLYTNHHLGGVGKISLKTRNKYLPVTSGPHQWFDLPGSNPWAIFASPPPPCPVLASLSPIDSSLEMFPEPFLSQSCCHSEAQNLVSRAAEWCPREGGAVFPSPPTLAPSPAALSFPARGQQPLHQAHSSSLAFMALQLTHPKSFLHT